jgi:hypothetical protein
MASGSKQKTTMAKLNRERNLRERRLIKQAKKDERKRVAAAGPLEATDDAPLDGDAPPEGEPPLHGSAPLDGEPRLTGAA